MRIIAPQKLLPQGLSGIHVLDDVKDHKLKPLAISVTKEIDASYEECGEGFMAEDGHHGLIIQTTNGDIGSFIIGMPWTMDPDDTTAWIGTAWTREDYRGKGLYRELYCALKMLAREQNLPSMGAGIYGSGRHHRLDRHSLDLRGLLRQGALARALLRIEDPGQGTKPAVDGRRRLCAQHGIPRSTRGPGYVSNHSL